MLLGEALSRAGRRTEGLREYAKGLEMLQPVATSSSCSTSIPRSRRPTPTPGQPDPRREALRPGTAPLSRRQDRGAESQFKQAINYFDKDARYHYWLGLCQIERPSRAKRQTPPTPGNRPPDLRRTAGRAPTR